MSNACVRGEIIWEEKNKIDSRQKGEGEEI
jgi:hypothetical protein